MNAVSHPDVPPYSDDIPFAVPKDTRAPALDVPKLRVINPAHWEGVAIPAREWIVPNLLPAKTVSMLSGDGATGKSLLAMQLCVARAIGSDWIGTAPEPGRSLYVSAEDDADEMHRRLEAIRAFRGVRWSDLSDLRLVDLVGENAVLGELSERGGTIQATLLYEAVAAEVAAFGPTLVVIDTLADAFSGDENHRSQVRQFISLMKGMARAHETAVLILSHPSLTGMASGSGSSGSTSWNNTVRSRLYFERAKAQDGTEPDPDVRTLTTKKANYGRSGDVLTVRWRDGIFVPLDGIDGLDAMARARKAEDTFLRLLGRLTEQGMNVSANNGPTHAPTIFARHPDAGGVTKQELSRAMMHLLGAGSIRIMEFGPASKRRSKLVVEA
ncbi:RecA-family ATPase [Inquilinus ginsengisoli]|uniref:AAA family ATPase n=1 Tax=Inquilinus ginsengisoli TaxID=363840 RepID=UPI003D1B81F0